MAPSTSPIVRSSGMPPASRTLALLASGVAFAFAEMQVRADGRIAVLGELAGDLDGRLVPAGHVMDDHHPGERAGSRRARQVRIDRVALVPAHLHGLARDGAIEDPARRRRGLRLCRGLLRLRGRCRSQRQCPKHSRRRPCDEIPSIDCVAALSHRNARWFLLSNQPTD